MAAEAPDLHQGDLGHLEEVRIALNGADIKPVSVASPGVHPPKRKWDGEMGLGKSGCSLCCPRPWYHGVVAPVRKKTYTPLDLIVEGNVARHVNRSLDRFYRFFSRMREWGLATLIQ